MADRGPDAAQLSELDEGWAEAFEAAAARLTDADAESSREQLCP